MSAAALDQRRAAPWQHGQNARSTLTQIVHPCKPGLCPIENPDERGHCVIKRSFAREQRNLEACPVPIVSNEETRKRIQAAIEKGDGHAMADLQAGLLAQLHDLTASELGKLSEEGLSIESPIVGKNAAGETEVVGYTSRVNPRAEPVTKFIEQLGATAAQQAITPKAAGEKKRDDGIGHALDFYARRAALAGPPMKRVESS